MFLKKYIAFTLLFAGFSHSGQYWHVEPGANSIKMLSMPSEPRQAALAGAGIASPRNTGEAMRNPLAGATAESPVLSFSKTEFSNKIGASRMSMLAHSVFSGWHLTAGIESLNYDKIQGYTEDGLTSDGLFFTQGTTSAQFGIAKTFDFLSAGLTARYASQDLEEHNVHGFLFDGGVKYDLQKYLSFGAIFSNLGWLASNGEARETAPLSVQAGITANCPLPLGFSSALSTDLYRRNDIAEEFRLGLEIMYQKLFAMRFGYPVSGEESDALSAGFAIKLVFADIEYAYQNRSALGANHIFGISIYF